MPEPVIVNVELEDSLTANACSLLAIEFVKYISYQRQQIPFPFKHLHSILLKKSALIQTSKVSGEISSTINVTSAKSIKIENEYCKVKQIFESMQSAFQHLEAEFCAPEVQVAEVAIILGSTPLSPRDVYRLQFPIVHHKHLASKHPQQRNLLKLFKCLIQSEDLHSMFSTAVAPTNLFILMQKKGKPAAVSGFIRKENYDLPQSGKHCVIKFIAPSVTHECICGGINIYRDQAECQPPVVDAKNTDGDSSRDNVGYVWFQANHTLKGFKDIKVNGTYVSSLWLHSR